MTLRAVIIFFRATESSHNCRVEFIFKLYDMVVYYNTTRCRYKLLHAKFQFYILKQQQNTCSLENVHSNAELILKKYNLYKLKNIRKKKLSHASHCILLLIHASLGPRAYPPKIHKRGDRTGCVMEYKIGEAF